MAELLKIEVTEKELTEGELYQNHVLVEMFYDNENITTKGGIIVGFNKDTDYCDPDDKIVESSRPADLAETCGRVVKTPQSLYFNPDDPEKSMPWDTEMDLCEDDLVWTNPIEALNAVTLSCNGKNYKILPYQDLYCAKREIWVDKWSVPQKKKTIVEMLNGYVLCEQVHKESLSALDVTSLAKIDKTKGIVVYIGTPNKRHLREEYCDFVDLRVGDEVLFDKKFIPFLLERTAYANKFGGIYWIVPRRRIVAVIKRA